MAAARVYRSQGGGVLRQLDSVGKRSRRVGVVVSVAMVMAAVPTGLAAAAEPPPEPSQAAVPGGLGGLVATLMQQLPLIGTPLRGPTTTTTIPGDAVADEAPVEAAIGVDLPKVSLPVITAPTIPPPPAAPPPSVAPPAAADPRPANTQVGIASWYNDKDGRCAHRTAPIGTVVTVTNLANGSSVQCTVTNRGPYAGGRVIDLSDSTFARIAPLSQGIADVRVEW